LSMLSSDDFLSAIHVNKQFYAARLKKSAWPALQLESFIQSLRDDDYDNPVRRRLRLRIPNTESADASDSLLSSAAAVFGSASSIPTASAWRFVTDVQLCNSGSSAHHLSTYCCPNWPVCPVLLPSTSIPSNFRLQPSNSSALPLLRACKCCWLKVFLYTTWWIH